MTNPAIQYSPSNAGTADTSRGPSPQIWGDCPWIEILGQAGQGRGGICFHDDFDVYGLATVVTTAIATVDGRYTQFGGAGATITRDLALGGGLVMSITDDNQSVTMLGNAASYQISANLGKLWFEARIKTSTITTAEQAWMVGLQDYIVPTATVPLTATGTIAATMNFVGFHKQEANTTAFDASYKANGVAAVEVNADVGTLAADTYIKLGMIFDPSTATTGTANQLAYYINGVRQTSFATIPDGTGDGFPADVRLSPIISALAATDDTETLTIDWWRVAQIIA